LVRRLRGFERQGEKEEPQKWALKTTTEVNDDALFEGEEKKKHATRPPFTGGGQPSGSGVALTMLREGDQKDVKK